MTKKKKKKKRAVSVGRLAAVAISALLVIGLAAYGIYFAVSRINAYREQQALKQEIEETIDQNQQLQAQIRAMQAPQGFDSDIYSSLQSAALDSIETASLDELMEQEDLERTAVEKQLQENQAGIDQEALYFLEHIDSYPEDIISYYLKDTDRFEFVKAYPNQDQYQEAPEALSESLESVPHLLQWDLRWGYEDYGDSTVYIAGCGPTSLSMIFSYLNQDPSITPAYMKTWSENNGYWVSGAGTANAIMTAAAPYFGIQAVQLYPSADSVINALQNGKLLILNVVPGKFTTVGHFIVVTEYDEETGQIQVLDPNSYSRTRMWDLDEVLEETAYVYSFSK